MTPKRTLLCWRQYEPLPSNGTGQCEPMRSPCVSCFGHVIARRSRSTQHVMAWAEWQLHVEGAASGTHDFGARPRDGATHSTDISGAEHCPAFSSHVHAAQCGEAAPRTAVARTKKLPGQIEACRGPVRLHPRRHDGTCSSATP